MNLSTSADAVEKEFDKIDSRVIARGLAALTPIAANQTSWQEISAAYSELTPEDRKSAALIEFEEYPGAPEPAAVDPNALPLEPTAPQPQAKRKFMHLYLNDFIQQVGNMVNWINVSREQGKLTPAYDFTKNKKFMEIYATLFSSNTYNIWPEQASTLESQANKLSTVISREDQLKIEAAIKAHPVANILISAIYGKDLLPATQPGQKPSHAGHLKTIKDEIGICWEKIADLKTRLASDTEKATITRHTNMIKKLHAQINELDNETKTMLADTEVSNADNPRNIMGKYVPPAPVPKTVKETVDLAMTLLSLEEAASSPQLVAKQVASKIFGLLYRAENFKVPSATDTFTNTDAYPFSTFVEAVAPYLYLIPLQLSSEASNLAKFKSIFRVRDEMIFVLKSGEKAAARLTDFTELASIASHFTPIATEPAKETQEDAGN